MTIFQKTIVKKYLSQQDTKILNDKWELFKTHFHNQKIKKNEPVDRSKCSYELHGFSAKEIAVVENC